MHALSTAAKQVANWQYLTLLLKPSSFMHLCTLLKGLVLEWPGNPWRIFKNLSEDNLKILNVISQALNQNASQWIIHFEMNSSEEFY